MFVKYIIKKKFTLSPQSSISSQYSNSSASSSVSRVLFKKEKIGLFTEIIHPTKFGQLHHRTFS
jgi:hypothetical protein